MSSDDRRMNLKVGDVVTLRSGGPMLTVVATDPKYTLCTGFVESVGFVDVRGSAECWKLESRIEDQS